MRFKDYKTFENKINDAHAFFDTMKLELQRVLSVFADKPFEVNPSTIKYNNGTLTITVSESVLQAIAKKYSLDHYKYRNSSAHPPVASINNLNYVLNRVERGYSFSHGVRKITKTNGRTCAIIDPDLSVAAEKFSIFLVNQILSVASMWIIEDSIQHHVVCEYPEFSIKEYEPLFKYSDQLKKLCEEEKGLAKYMFPFVLTAIYFANLADTEFFIEDALIRSDRAKPDRLSFVFSDKFSMKLHDDKMVPTRTITADMIDEVMPGWVLVKATKKNIPFLGTDRYSHEHLQMLSDIMTRKISVPEIEKILHEKRGRIQGNRFKF